MADHIKTRIVDGTWVVRAGGAVIGESDSAVELTEGGYDPVIYFPRDDVAMAFLDRTETLTHSPQKGDAAHFSIQTKSTTLRDAAWSYEDPKSGVQAIAGHIAFYPDKATVEQL